VDTEEAFVITQMRRVVPITGQFDGARFITAIDGRRVLTPLAVALVLVETMDLIFALDSIPATFAITTDPFLVFTSNVFAILGLRSLYFVLARVIERFRYLKVSLAAILGLIGVKMLVADLLHEWMGANFSLYLLGMVVLILAAGVAASVRADRQSSRSPT
jgi:tellurite resistance protein TerC